MHYNLTSKWALPYGPVSIFVFLLLLTPFSWSKEKSNPKGITVLIIGDSITAGYGVESSSAYPKLLETKLNKALKSKMGPIKVINSGVSGSTTASALGRLKWSLKAKPNFVVIALGGNDGLRGIPISATQKNLEKTIEFAKQKKLKIILAGMKLPTNYGKDYRSNFEKLFSTLAKKHNLLFYPFLLEGVGGVGKLNLPDGIHPIEEGHKVIAKKVGDFLIRTLK